jgi:hypothetical protein
MTDSEVIEQIQRHWKSSRGFRATLPLVNMLKGYRQMKADGKSDNDIVIYWSSPSVGMDRMDAGTFVAAMKQINAGRLIQDPNEKPSWSEVLDESGLPGTKKFELPWVKVTAIGAVALFVVWGLPNLVKATRDSGHRKPELPK